MELTLPMLFEESVKSLEMRPGMIVKGHVLEVGPDMVVVHAGLKSEGVIPLSEFKDINGELEVQVGDEVEVAVDAFEDGFGETKLSREKAKRSRAWEDLEKDYVLYLLNKNKWNITRAARDAKINRSTFDSRMKRLGINKR